MESITKFGELMKHQTEVPVQTQWVKAKQVDWDKKTMTGTADDLDWPGIQLYNGHTTVKPVKDSLCLIGLIGNDRLNAFLLIAMEPEITEVELTDHYQLKSETTELIAGKDGLSLKRQNESLGELVGLLIDEINKITVPTGTGPSGVPVNAPAFATLKQRFSNVLIA